MIDCMYLSKNAQLIFERITRHFPPDPWKKPQWEPEGRVHDNIWLDLRKSADRRKLMDQIKSQFGYLIGLKAGMYRKEHGGSLRGFRQVRLTPHDRDRAELLLLLEDLDFQIETGDLIED